MLLETSGTETELLEVQDLGNAACSRDLCRVVVSEGGREWIVLATRSTNLVEIDPLKQACASADIVISDRTLPVTCTPRWLKLDRPFLARSGGLAINLGESPHVSSVADRVGRHPWTAAAYLK